MKIPHRVTGSTRPSAMGMDYLSAAGATPDAFGAGIGRGLQSVAAMVGVLGEREEAKNRFGALRELDNFQTQVKLDLTDAKRKADPSGAGYHEQAKAIYAQAEERFLQRIPAELRDEFSWRSGQVKQGVLLDAVSFEYQAGDTWFRTEIGEAFNQAKVVVGEDQKMLESELARLRERIDATDLSEMEKADLFRQQSAALAGIAYKQEILEVERGRYEAAAGGVDLYLDKVFHAESGGAADAKNPNSSAYGPGQFIARTWIDLIQRHRPDIAATMNEAEILQLRSNTGLAREMGAALAQENATRLSKAGLLPSPSNLYVAHFLGGAGAVAALSAEDSTPIEDVTSPAARAANKEVFAQVKTVGDLKQWAIGKMGYAEHPKIEVRQDADGFWQTEGLRYETAGKIRALPISREYIERVVPAVRAIDPSLTVVITSGGQNPLGVGGSRTGSTRHDVDHSGESGTADLVLERNGRKILPGQDKALYAKVMEEMAAAGFTGIGHYAWGIHVGGGSRAAWGPSTTSTDLDPTFARAIKNGWARMAEGGRDAIDTDMRYIGVSYEDRLAARSDAERQATQERTAQLQQAKLEQAGLMNSLLVGINDGQFGATEIEQARQTWLTDYDDIKKVQDTYKAANEGVLLSAQAAQKLSMPTAVWDPTDDRDRKMLNSLVKPGLSELAKGNQDYFTSAILPLVNQTGDIPTDVIGTLTGMVRANNATQALFALDALRQLRDVDARAFNGRVPEALAKDVDFYAARRDLYPQDEMLRMINGGYTQEERQRRTVLEKEAQSYLAEKKDGVPTLHTLVKDVVGEFGGWFSSPALSGIPAFAKELDMDYQTAFVDAFVKTGDTEKANTLAVETLKRSWSVTAVGGANVLMKYPPERVGYKAVGGTYDWITRQVRDELKLGDDETFQLISDDQTKQEFQQFQLGADAPPSYMIVVKNADGQLRLRMGDDGLPERHFFAPTAADRAAETRDFLQRDAQREYDNLLPQWEGARMLEMRQGIPVPPELEKRKLELERVLREEQFGPPIPQGTELEQYPQMPVVP